MISFEKIYNGPGAHLDKNESITQFDVCVFVLCNVSCHPCSVMFYEEGEDVTNRYM